MDDRLTTKQNAFIAAYLGEADFNATKAAKIAGYSVPRASGQDALQNPVIKQIINEHLDTLRDTGLGNKAVRLAELNSLNEKLKFVMDSRAKSAKARYENGEDIPEEAESGLMAEVQKQVGTGQNAVITQEWQFDKGLYDSILKTHEQAAKEVGDRDKKIELSGANGGPIQIESAKDKLRDLLGHEQES